MTILSARAVNIRMASECSTATASSATGALTASRRGNSEPASPTPNLTTTVRTQRPSLSAHAVADFAKACAALGNSPRISRLAYAAARSARFIPSAFVRIADNKAATTRHPRCPGSARLDSIPTPDTFFSSGRRLLSSGDRDSIRERPRGHCVKELTRQQTDWVSRAGQSSLSESQRVQLHRLRATLERWADRLDRGDLMEDAHRLLAEIDAALDPLLPPDQVPQRYATAEDRLESFLEKLTRFSSGTKDVRHGR
jgi:hypothetical protein